ncbi:MAG: hypothetical protein ACXIVQ_12475 [Acidimicrobiales bacterium]
MTRRPVRVVAWLAAGVAVLAMAVGPGARSGVAQSDAPPDLGPVEACAALPGPLLVAVAVADVGPDTGAVVSDFVARQLQRVGQRVGDDAPIVEVLVLGVTTESSNAVRWDVVEPSSRPRIETAVQTALGEVAADTGARGWVPLATTLSRLDELVAERRSDSGGEDDPGCDLVVVVGDGSLDLASGSDLVCGPGAPIEALRDAGRVVTATAPVVEGPSAEAAQALAGVGAGCGPTGGGRGVALTADRPAGLAVDLDVVASALAGRATVGTAVTPCVGTTCDEGTIPVRLDRTLSRATITVALPSDESEVLIGLPRGIQFPVADRVGGPIDLGSVVLDTTWVLPDVVRLDAPVSAADDDWAGDWTVTVVEPGAGPDASVGRAQVVVGLSPGVVAEFAAPPQLVGGRSISTRVDLVDGGGRRVDVGDLDGLVEVEIVVRALDGTEITSGRLVADDLGGARGSVTAPDRGDDPEPVVVSAVVTSVSGDVPIGSITTSSDSVVVPGSSWPTSGTSLLRLRGDAGENAAGSLELVAGPGLDACIWLEGASDGLDGLVLGDGARSAASCETVPADSSRSIPVSLELTGVDVGVVGGTASIALGVVGSDTFDLVEVPVEVVASPPIDTGLRIVLTALLAMGGLLVPLVVIWLWDWVRARFRLPRSAVVADVPIAVGADGSLARADAVGVPLLVSNDMFEPAGWRGGRRHTWRGLRLAVRNSATPLSPPVGTVASPDGPVVAGHGAIVDDDTVVGRVPLAVAGSWIFELDPDATRAAAVDPQAPDFYAAYGRLVLVRASAEAPPIDLAPLPRLAQRLARTVRASRRSAPVDSDMLEFVETNVSRPRDLPRTGPAIEGDRLPADGGAVDLPEVSDEAFDPYDFSESSDVFEPVDRSHIPPVEPPRVDAGPTGDVDDQAGVAEEADAPGVADEADVPSDDDDGDGGIVFEERLNPSAFRFDLTDPTAADPLLAPEVTTEPEPRDDPGLRWARKARPRWPTVRRDDD